MGKERARNESNGLSGSNTGQGEAQVSQESGEGQFRLLVGRIAALIGIIIVLLTTSVMFIVGSAEGSSISGGIISLALGATGYFLGARKIGLVALVLGVIGVVLSLAVTSGIVPGVSGGGHNLFQGPPGNQQP